MNPAYLLTSLGPWAAAFAARRCAGDDLLDELRAAAMPSAVVDSSTGDATGWLELVGPAASLSVRLPAPGDPAGIAPGPAARAAAVAGEALVVAAPDRRTVVVVGERDADRAARWVGYPVDGPTAEPHIADLGDARRTLLDVVDDATAVLTGLPGTSAGDPATLRAELAVQTARFAPALPPGAHARAVDVAGLAAQVLGTVALAEARLVSFGITGAHAQRSTQTLREVATAARHALAAAVNRVMAEYARSSSG